MPTSTQAPWISDYDMYLLEEGTHCRAYEKMGAHLGELAGQRGVHFAVWAPNAKQVSVLGDFNGWNPQVECPGSARCNRSMGGLCTGGRGWCAVQVSHYVSVPGL